MFLFKNQTINFQKMAKKQKKKVPMKSRKSGLKTTKRIKQNLEVLKKYLIK